MTMQTQISCMIRWKQMIKRVTSRANLFKKFVIWIYNEYIRYVYRNQWPSWLAPITVASNLSASAALSWISTGSLTMEQGCKRDLAVWDRDFWFKSETETKTETFPNCLKTETRPWISGLRPRRSRLRHFSRPSLPPYLQVAVLNKWNKNTQNTQT